MLSIIYVSTLQFNVSYQINKYVPGTGPIVALSCSINYLARGNASENLACQLSNFGLSAPNTSDLRPPPTINCEKMLIRTVFSLQEFIKYLQQFSAHRLQTQIKELFSAAASTLKNLIKKIKCPLPELHSSIAGHHYTR